MMACWGNTHNGCVANGIRRHSWSSWGSRSSPPPLPSSQSSSPTPAHSSLATPLGHLRCAQLLVSQTCPSLSSTPRVSKGDTQNAAGTTLGAFLKCRFLSSTPNLQGVGPGPRHYKRASTWVFSVFVPCALRIWFWGVFILFFSVPRPLCPLVPHTFSRATYFFSPRWPFPSSTLQRFFLEIHFLSASWIRGLVCFARFCNPWLFFFPPMFEKYLVGE